MDSKTRTRLGLTAEGDGEIWMTVEDFCCHFERLYSYRCFSHCWPTIGCRDYILTGQWQGDRSGGCPEHRSFLRNPQYRLDIGGQGPQKVWIFLLQLNSVETPAEIGIFLTKVEKNRKFRIHTRQEPVLTSQYLPVHSFTVYVTLERGRYVLVPGTKNPNTDSRYILRVSSVRPLRVRELREDMPRKVTAILRRPLTLLVTSLTIQTLKGMKSAASPEVRVTCSSHKSKTHVVPNTLNPRWNVPMVFYHKPNAVIHFKVLNSRRLGRSKVMGRGQLVPSVMPEQQTIRLPLEVVPFHPPLTLDLGIWTHADPMEA